MEEVDSGSFLIKWGQGMALPEVGQEARCQGPVL